MKSLLYFQVIFYYSVVIIHFAVTNSHKYQLQHEPSSEHVIFFDHTSQLETSWSSSLVLWHCFHLPCFVYPVS